MPDQPEQQRLHAFVEGYVQGVGFRDFVQRIAYPLNVTGWVRNRRDGSVEVVAEGPRPALDKLLQALYRGPRAGTTQGVNVQWEPATGEFKSFNVRMTSE